MKPSSDDLKRSKGLLQAHTGVLALLHFPTTADIFLHFSALVLGPQKLGLLPVVSSVRAT